VISQSLGTKERINAMIQMHDEKTMLKTLLSNYKFTSHESFLIHGTLQMVCISFSFMWDKPLPPHRLPMMCNNLKVVEPPKSIVFQFEIDPTHLQLCSSLN
jgi:hypothetical protein